MRRNPSRHLAVLIALLCIAVSTISVSAIAPAPEKTTGISLNSNQTTDNSEFTVSNMFPGDSTEKKFCVSVSHTDSVTVHFGASVDAGGEKLAEVLKMRVTGPDNAVLYDGLVRDLADSKYNLTGSGDDELTYTIEAYLDTSVGNEYMEKELSADLSWWVSDVEVQKLSGGGRGYSKWWYEWKEQLAQDSTAGQSAAKDAAVQPETGDSFPLVPVAAAAFLSAAGLIFLLRHRKHGEGDKNA